ncbi:MAG TPA: hypothetical protein VD907_05220 [Verrucomicrobiae bacterium]|nr:hypothetical protein [Verrucomicrobiae bacterium]
MTEEIKIKSKDKTLSNYNPGMLLQSILKSFAHRSDAASDSYWLMQSVEDKLASSQLLEIEIDELQRLIFYTVHNFDKLAGMQYAAQHNVTHLLKKP